MTTLQAPDSAAEVQRLRRVADHALQLRHSIYYAADPGTDMEKWANELGAVLASLEWGLAQLDQPAVLVDDVDPERTCGTCARPLHRGRAEGTGSE